MINPCVIRCTNCVDGRICAAILAAAEIKCAALYKMAVQTFQGEVVGLGVFRVATETVEIIIFRQI